MATSAIPTSIPEGSAKLLNRTWVAGPVIGSVLGVATVFAVIVCTPRNQRRRAKGTEPAIEDLNGDSSHSTQGKAQLHADCVPARELGSCEIHELPVVEPVGSELHTPRDKTTTESGKEWPLPLSPLPLLFAMVELRDKRAGHNPPKHNTFYHP
jgi:hypothetical protein